MANETDVDGFTRWTTNRAALFDRLQTIRKDVEKNSTNEIVPRYFVWRRNSHKPYELLYVYQDAYALKSALGKILLSVWEDLRDSRSDGDKIARDIIARHSPQTSQ